MKLTADNLTVHFGDRRVLDGLSFSLTGGEIVGLIGPNGAGKTSALKAVAGLLPASGAIRFDGRPVSAMAARERARSIAYLAQGAACHWPLVVERLVALGRLPHLQPWAQPAEADALAVDAALEACDLLQFRDRAVTALSQGERARALLARALAVQSRLLLADEPVAALDPRHQLEVMQVLQRRAQDGMAVLVVLHDLSLAARFCDRLLLLAEGRLLAEGAPASVLTADLLRQAYGITAELGRREGALYVVPWAATP